MRIIDLEACNIRAQVAPGAGGRLLQLEVRAPGGDWLSLLRTPADPRRAIDDPLAWGSYPMLPWPNRIAGGRFTFAGWSHDLPRNSEGHAIHGLAFDRPCGVTSVSRRACSLVAALGERWPFAAHGVIAYALRNGAIEQRIEVHGDGPAFPAGAGWHPWFRRVVRPGARPRVLVDAGEVQELADMIPTGAVVPVGGDADLRGYPELRDQRLDACYVHPRGPLGIRWGELELSMRSSENVRYAVVYTGAADAVCVEPQSCAIDAFNLRARGTGDHGVAIVEPGRPLVVETVWSIAMLRYEP